MRYLRLGRSLALPEARQRVSSRSLALRPGHALSCSDGASHEPEHLARTTCPPLLQLHRFQLDEDVADENVSLDP